MNAQFFQNFFTARISTSNSDQDNDFAVQAVLASFTLFRNSPFNDSVSDLVQTSNDSYLLTRFSIYGGIFRIRSVY